MVNSQYAPHREVVYIHITFLIRYNCTLTYTHTVAECDVTTIKYADINITFIPFTVPLNMLSMHACHTLQ